MKVINAIYFLLKRKYIYFIKKKILKIFNYYDLGWYSVTPEEISVYIAELCKGKVVLDAFGGCGGNTIQFSRFCQKVYYNELDENKVSFCRNNCKVYDCDENIEFINEDFLKLKYQINVKFFINPYF